MLMLMVKPPLLLNQLELGKCFCIPHRQLSLQSHLVEGSSAAQQRHD